jgi:hypothetical protein
MNEWIYFARGNAYKPPRKSNPWKPQHHKREEELATHWTETENSCRICNIRFAIWAKYFSDHFGRILNTLNRRCPKSQQVQSGECSNVGKGQLRLTIITQPHSIIGLFIYSTKACLRGKTPPRLGHLKLNNFYIWRTKAVVFYTNCHHINGLFI